MYPYLWPLTLERWKSAPENHSRAWFVLQVYASPQNSGAPDTFPQFLMSYPPSFITYLKSIETILNNSGYCPLWRKKRKGTCHSLAPRSSVFHMLTVFQELLSSVLCKSKPYPPFISSCPHISNKLQFCTFFSV